MKTVKEVSELTGISIRTLRYYDEINLLKPAEVTEAGYRLYDEKALTRLRQIMFFRELEVPLAEIKEALKNPERDNREILETQKILLEIKRNRLNGLIELISDILKGEKKMSFEAFTNEDILKIIRHSLDIMSEEDKKAIIRQYGDIEKFKEAVFESFNDEKACEHLIRIYGSKDKAVAASLESTKQSRREIEEQRISIDSAYKQFAAAMVQNDETLAMGAVKALGESYKQMFRVENPRALLLEVARDYLRGSQLEEATDQQYGSGITKYIGSAICRYYGV